METIEPFLALDGLDDGLFGVVEGELLVVTSEAPYDKWVLRIYLAASGKLVSRIDGIAGDAPYRNV